MANNQIAVNEEKDIIYSSFILRKNGLSAIGNPSFEQWNECGEFIKKAEGSVHWWIGDWLNYGESTYGETYTNAISTTDFEYQTVANDKYVSDKIEFSRRRENVSWGVHAEIAPYKPEEQELLLEKAEKENLTVQKIRKEKHRLLIEAQRPTVTLDSNLILGDSLEELKKLQDKSIDCVITDPPYGIDYQSNRRTLREQLDKIRGDKDDAFELLENTCDILSSKVKPNSHLYFFTSWKVYSRFEEIIGKHFDISNVLVWDKENHGSGDLEGNYGEQYELIIFATTGRRILNGDRPVNIIRYPKATNLQHPTEKPTGLIEKLIEVSTNKDELVLDPFMGSGSTCVAAKNKSRKYLGIEIDKQWFELAQRRING